MKRLQAFTLIELLVGMILSGIVIAFGYGSFTLIQRQFFSFRSIKNEMKESAQLHAVISSDFFRADLVSWKNEALHISCEPASVIYSFRDSLVIRNVQEENDTFRLRSSAHAPLYLFPGASTVIRHFSYSAIVLGEAGQFNYSKNYSAADIISMEQSLQQTNPWE